MVGQKENVEPLSKILQKGIDESPVPVLNQVYLGCTQREPKVDHEAVQSKADSFRRITTNEVTNDKSNPKYKFFSTDHSME